MQNQKSDQNTYVTAILQILWFLNHLIESSSARWRQVLRIYK